MHSSFCFQSKLAQEHLLIPRIYYPWIRGPFNKTVEKIIAETGARVNIPPNTAQTEIISVTGEKEGVYAAAAAIKQIHEEKVSTSRLEHDETILSRSHNDRKFLGKYIECEEQLYC